MIRHRRWLLGLGLVLAGVASLTTPGEAGILDASWIAPTTNTDGTDLTDLASYRVYYDMSSAPCRESSYFEVASLALSPPPNQIVTLRLTGLSAGTSYFVSVTAVDESGNESTCATSLGSAVARIEFAVSPIGTVGFSSVSVWSFADRVLTVSNTSGGTLSGSVSVSAPFSIVSGSPFSLVGLGATQAATVRFTPTASATATANIAFAADGDTISRIVTGIGTDTTPPTANPMTSPDTGGNTPTTVPTVTPTDTLTFTDDPLVTQDTPIRAVHLMELRAAIDNLRLGRGLRPFDWTDPNLSPRSTPIKGAHLIELRTGVNEAYQRVGRTPPIYTDPNSSVVAWFTAIKAIHLNELRTAVRALADMR